MKSFTRIEADGSVTSVQTHDVAGVTLPEGEALEALLRELIPAYTSWISLLTAGAVEIVHLPSGESLARVQPLGPVGLRLGPARILGGKLSRPIEGGVLVGRPGGTLDVELEPIPGGGVRASVALHGFRPRVLDIPLAGAKLFFATQDVIHVRHSRGFLTHAVEPRLDRSVPDPVVPRVERV